MRPSGTDFNAIWIRILSFSFMKMHLKMSSARMAAILSRGRWVNIQHTDTAVSWGVKWLINFLLYGWLAGEICVGNLSATLLTIPYTVYSRYIAVVYITESDISRSHVGPHFLAIHFANFADMAPKSAIFCEIAVIPWTPFVGDSFLRNLLTAVAFDLARKRQFVAKSALGQSGLPVKCGQEHMLCDGQPRKTDHWHLHCITE